MDESQNGPASAGEDGTAQELSRRQRILAVAAEEFSEKGYAAVRIDEIAARADCNKQLIYYYFGNKAGLYDAVLEEMVAGMVPAWESMESADLESALVALPRTGNRMWRRLLTWEGLEYGAEPGREIRLAVSRTRAWSRPVDILRRAQERGEIAASFDPEMLTLAVVMFAQTSHVLPQVTQMITGSIPDSEEFAERQEKFLRALVRALSHDG